MARLHLLSVGRSSYTSRILGTLASLFVEVAEGRTSPSTNGTNRSRLRHPFNPSRMNKAVECFEGTSVEQTRHVQSLTDILRKVVPKHDIIKKQWVPGHFLFPRSAKGPAYKATFNNTVNCVYTVWKECCNAILSVACQAQFSPFHVKIRSSLYLVSALITLCLVVC